jgi:hypothetical protein
MSDLCEDAFDAMIKKMALAIDAIREDTSDKAKEIKKVCTLELDRIADHLYSRACYTKILDEKETAKLYAGYFTDISKNIFASLLPKTHYPSYKFSCMHTFKQIFEAHKNDIEIEKLCVQGLIALAENQDTKFFSIGDGRDTIEQILKNNENNAEMKTLCARCLFAFTRKRLESRDTRGVFDIGANAVIELATERKLDEEKAITCAQSLIDLMDYIFSGKVHTCLETFILIAKSVNIEKVNKLCISGAKKILSDLTDKDFKAKYCVSIFNQIFKNP